jgi:hypothetical protein
VACPSNQSGSCYPIRGRRRPPPRWSNESEGSCAVCAQCRRGAPRLRHNHAVSTIYQVVAVDRLAYTHPRRPSRDPHRPPPLGPRSRRTMARISEVLGAFTRRRLNTGRPQRDASRHRTHHRPRRATYRLRQPHVSGIVHDPDRPPNQPPTRPANGRPGPRHAQARHNFNKPIIQPLHDGARSGVGRIPLGSPSIEAGYGRHRPWCKDRECVGFTSTP